MKYRLTSSGQYDKWFLKLKDRSVKLKILARLNRLENGNFGDFKQLRVNLFELRFFFGAGLRIYYTFHDDEIVLLLVGGNKSKQPEDVKRAIGLLKQLED